MSEPGASRTTDQRTITVVGEGLASTVPDTALLHLGVETRGATPWPGAGGSILPCPLAGRGVGPEEPQRHRPRLSEQTSIVAATLRFGIRRGQ